MNIIGIQRLLWVFAALAALVVAGCATGPKPGSQDAVIYQYTGALRWDGLESAWRFVDPAYREANPLTSLERERFAQVEVKGYQLVSTEIGPDQSLVREVDISLVNRHTMRERVVRHREVWRWDEASGRWWLGNGLPSLTSD